MYEQRQGIPIGRTYILTFRTPRSGFDPRG
jgi:hypothetical protein